MTRKYTKTLLNIALSGCLASLASFSAVAQAGESAEPIKISLNNWASQRVLANVSGKLLQQIGYNVEYHQADAQRQFPLMGSGKLHYQVEVWQGTMEAPFERQVSRKRIIDAGSHQAITREEWWYPDYLEEVCPGLPDWKALNKCAVKLSTPETKPLGRYLAGPTDWERPDRERIEALGLNYEVVNVINRQSLRAELDQAIANKQPILVYNWTPNWTDGKYPGKFVEFPEFHRNCETDAGWGENPLLKHDCGNPKKGWLKKAVWSEFPEKWSCGFELIKNINFNNDQISAAAAYAEVDEMSPEEAANRWISENQAVWKQWMPTCAGSVKLNDTKAVKTEAATTVAATVDASALAKSKNCMACHGIENKIVGPAFKDIAAKYKGNEAAVATLVAKVKNGGAGNWGEIPMPPNPGVSDADTETLVKWILSQ